jgi:uncharacterized Ntn-hydrolase superfamily protein
MEFSILGYCPRSRQFGIGAISSAFGGPGGRLAARAWRGIVYCQDGSNLPSVARTESLLEEGWRGQALLDETAPREDASSGRLLVTIDAAGLSFVKAGESARQTSSLSSATHVCAVSSGASSAAAAAQMRKAFESCAREALAERLVRALESVHRAADAQVLSAFIRVYDPAIEYAYADVTVDLHDEPVAELRRAHDWLCPLYEYYAIRGQDPTVPRYPQWLAQQGIQRS